MDVLSSDVDADDTIREATVDEEAGRGSTLKSHHKSVSQIKSDSMLPTPISGKRDESKRQSTNPTPIQKPSTGQAQPIDDTVLSIEPSIRKQSSKSHSKHNETPKQSQTPSKQQISAVPSQHD